MGNSVSNLNSNEGCLCSNARFPLFNLATSTSGSCVSSCPRNNWLCEGRAQSTPVRFCSASNLASGAGFETVANCTLLDRNYVLNSTFDRNDFLTSYAISQNNTLALSSGTAYQQNALVFLASSITASTPAAWRYIFDLDLSSQFVRIELGLSVSNGFSVALYNTQAQLYSSDAARACVMLNFGTNGSSSVTASYQTNLNVGSPTVSSALLPIASSTPTSASTANYVVTMWVQAGL